MIKTVVCGASGRMGSLISQLIARDKNFSLVGAVERINHPEIDKEIEGIRIVRELAKVVEKSDVVIEFTAPAATLAHLAICEEKGVPMVIGTTGFSQEEMGKIEDISKKIPILLSPNMSLGVNLLFKLIKEAAVILKDYEVEIIETHHDRKKDAPSGTAKRIAEIIAESRNSDLEKIAKYGRKGLVGKRNPEEIGIHSLRLGNVIGEHRVIFGGIAERLELFHKAESRETFARGALKAAAFIVKQHPGLYGMESILCNTVKH
ncbi:MAG: 4-hydroxy-tetrahydrodipicolinate reductase [Candidatus Omnitrophica bacterium]|nr:4-hydroxy-tetrahydrodipicolinate reductase [Candidatus Omnitrophota bacterium]